MGKRKAPISPPASPAQTDLQRFEAAFTEWDRRYREDPEAFMNAAARLLKGTPETYGEAAAPYFVSILDEMK